MRGPTFGGDRRRRPKHCRCFFPWSRHQYGVLECSEYPLHCIHRWRDASTATITTPASVARSAFSHKVPAQSCATRGFVNIALGWQSPQWVMTRAAYNERSNNMGERRFGAILQVLSLMFISNGTHIKHLYNWSGTHSSSLSRDPRSKIQDCDFACKSIKVY